MCFRLCLAASFAFFPFFFYLVLFKLLLGLLLRVNSPSPPFRTHAGLHLHSALFGRIIVHPFFFGPGWLSSLQKAVR